MKAMLANTLLILLLSYAAIVVLMYLRQGSMLYLPQKELLTTPKNIHLPYEALRLRTSDGITISGWYVPAEKERAALIFCHGNAGNISGRLDSIAVFHRLGLSVMIFDYRGYGESEGRPSEPGTYLDAEAAWNYLTDVKETPPGRIIVFGRSLGGAVAAELALRRPPAALILEAGFTSVPDIGSTYYPWLPVRLLSKFKYASVEKVGAISCPKLIIHSPQDEIIPYAHGRKLFEVAGEPKTFLEITGGHNDGFLVSGSTYTDGLNDFVTENFGGK